MTRTTVMTAAAAVAVAGLGVAGVIPAQADGPEREKVKQCQVGGATTSLSLEKERGNRIEAEFEVERANRFETWQVRMRHNGKLVLHSQRTTDDEGDLDVISQLRDRAGRDKVRVVARTGSGAVCKITVRI